MLARPVPFFMLLGALLIGASVSIGACSMQSGTPTTATLSVFASPTDAEAPGEAASPTSELDCTEQPSEDRRALVCRRWRCDQLASKDKASFTGDVATCAAGELDPEAGDRALRLINLHRLLVNAPPVQVEPAWAKAAQACALIAHANGRLSHEPPRDWACWSPLGAATSAVSLIANRSAPVAINAFVEDPGNEMTMVHRRWLLSEELTTIGVGSTDRYGCVIVAGDLLGIPRSVSASGDAGSAAKRGWVAWPPSGPVPYDVFVAERLDEVGWTLHTSKLVLDRATVRVSLDGRDLALRTNTLTPLYGSRSAIRFVPDGWKTEAGATYSVHVQGARSDEDDDKQGGAAIDYEVEVANCGT